MIETGPGDDDLIPLNLTLMTEEGEDGDGLVLLLTLIDENVEGVGHDDLEERDHILHLTDAEETEDETLETKTILIMGRTQIRLVLLNSGTASSGQSELILLTVSPSHRP